MHEIFEQVRIALHTVWKRRWLALGVAWGVSLLGWLAISTIPNSYESKASVFVQMQSLLPDKLGISPLERQNAVETIQRTLTSAENLEKVVRSTELAKPGATPREIADAVIGLRSAIEITNVQDNTFEIVAESGSGGFSNARNAKMAKDIVQKLLDLFVEGNLSGGRVETTQTLRFLDGQLGQREQQLQEAEAKRVAFEQKYMGLLPGAGSVSQRMEIARAELIQLEANLSAAQGALAGLNGQLAGTSPSISTPGQYVGGGGGSQRVAGIEQQMAEARSRGWTENHPDMIGLRAQLGAARVAARAEGGAQFSSGTSTPNPSYVMIRSQLAEKQATLGALSSRKAQLQAEMTQYQAKISEEPGVAAEQQRLNRDYEVLKAQYDKLLADREEVKLRGSLQTDTDAITVKVLEPPTTPRSPAAPNRPLLLTLALLAGAAAGLGAAFLMGQIQSSYATAGQLARATGLPVVGAVSEVVGSIKRAHDRQRLAYFAGGTAALVGAWILLLSVEIVQRGMVA